jgi:hypothetical protein
VRLLLQSTMLRMLWVVAAGGPVADDVALRARRERRWTGKSTLYLGLLLQFSAGLANYQARGIEGATVGALPMAPVRKTS